MTAHALSLQVMKARPGGIMRAFCEPVQQTSMCQASVRHSIAPMALINPAGIAPR